MLKPTDAPTTTDQSTINSAIDLVLSSPASMSAEQKHAVAEAAYQKGHHYQFGLNGSPVDLKQAKMCYKIGVKLGHVNSMTALGACYLYHFKPNKAYYYDSERFDSTAKLAINHSKAASLLFAASMKKSTEAMYHYGVLKCGYSSIILTEVNISGTQLNSYTDAITAFKSGIRIGNVFSMVALANLYIQYPILDSMSAAGYLYRSAYFRLPADGSPYVAEVSKIFLTRQFVLEKMNKLSPSLLHQYLQLTTDATFPVTEFMRRAQQEPALYFAFVCDDTLPTLAQIDARLQAKFTLAALEKTLAESPLLSAAAHIGKLFNPGKKHAVRELKDFLISSKKTDTYFELIRSDRSNNIHASNYQVFSFLLTLKFHLENAVRQLDNDKSDEPLKKSLLLVEGKLEKIKVLLQQQMRNEVATISDANAASITTTTNTNSATTVGATAGSTDAGNAELRLAPPTPLAAASTSALASAAPTLASSVVTRSALWSQVDLNKSATENPELPPDAPGYDL